MKFFLDLTDRRLNFVFKKLSKEGKECFDIDWKFKEVKEGDFVILSPAFKFNELTAKKLPKKVTLICGNVPDEVKQIFESKKINYINIMLDEDFVLKNASYTAEGMLSDLIQNTKSSIFEQNILILGSGRVAKAVSYLFFKLGLKFDLTMRDEKKLKLSTLIAGKSIKFENFKDELKNYDVVINTIPSKLFVKEDLKKFKDDSVCFELASKQCLEGLTIDNFKYVLCPALPSKYTPESAGNLIFHYLKKVLGEEK